MKTRAGKARNFLGIKPSQQFVWYPDLSDGTEISLFTFTFSSIKTNQESWNSYFLIHLCYPIQ